MNAPQNFHREPGGDRKDSRPVNISDLYHADPAGFWRGLAAVLALVAMLPFVACLGV